MEHFSDFHLISDNAGKNDASSFGVKGNPKKAKLDSNGESVTDCKMSTTSFGQRITFKVLHHVHWWKSAWLLQFQIALQFPSVGEWISESFEESHKDSCHVNHTVVISNIISSIQPFFILSN